MMDQEKCSKTRKEKCITTTKIFLFAFCMSSVCCEMVCPPAVENLVYTLNAEVPKRKNAHFTATWYFGDEVLAICNLTKDPITCKHGSIVGDKIFEDLVSWYGEGKTMMAFDVISFSNDLQQNYSILWNVSGVLTKETCTVSIEFPNDECPTQKPCKNALYCPGCLMGQHCPCEWGYFNEHCHDGDPHLYCSPLRFFPIFNKQTDRCRSYNTSCYTTGVDKQTNIGLKHTQISNNGNYVLDVTSYIRDMTHFFQVCITSSTPKGTYRIDYKLTHALSEFNYYVRIDAQVYDFTHSTTPVTDVTTSVIDVINSGTSNSSSSHNTHILSYKYLVFLIEIFCVFIIKF